MISDHLRERAGGRDGSAGFVISTDFDTGESLRAYLTHPTRQLIVFEAPCRCGGERHSVQFQNQREAPSS